SFIGNAYSTPGEVCLAIICACFPTVRPLFRHVVQATHSRLIHSSSSSLSSRDRHRLYAKQDRSSNDQPWLTHEKPYAVDGRGSHDPGRSAMALPASQAVAFSDSKSQPDIECGLASSRINVQKEVVLARD
ncbi:hypothetical protein MMC16_004740, partial [Acarospora aff. strigata]|nr:hypothetical protein [Acarospora aff. strigata]